MLMPVEPVEDDGVGPGEHAPGRGWGQVGEDPGGCGSKHRNSEKGCPIGKRLNLGTKTCGIIPSDRLTLSHTQVTKSTQSSRIHGLGFRKNKGRLEVGGVRARKKGPGDPKRSDSRGVWDGSFGTKTSGGGVGKVRKKSSR